VEINLFEKFIYEQMVSIPDK